jgi:L-aminopeptidase/D-esterase-like protein
VRWCEERGLGRSTPLGVVPLVPTAVIYDESAAEAGARPSPDDGYAACEAAVAGVPVRGRVGAGAGAAVGKLLGREHATPGGVGYAAVRLADGVTVAAVAVANAFGDVLAEDGATLGGPQDERGAFVRTAEIIRQAAGPPPGPASPGMHTTLACVCTDAAIDKRGCGIVTRIASAGIARAVDPAFTPIDGDVVFCLASGTGAPPPPGLVASWTLTVLGAAAATVTAAAIRDAIRSGHAKRRVIAKSPT